MGKEIKIAIVLGTRPELIKLSSVIRACQNFDLNFFIVHSNQHYSSNMDKVFFEELNLPLPKYNLKIKESLHGQMTGKQLIAIEEIFLNEKPDWVIVQGDTNTVLSASLAASKLNIKIAHVEAGLRSYDRTMPEEINRVITDHLSSLLFAPTKKQAQILINEGIEENKIEIVGNTIVDAVLQNLELASKLSDFKEYSQEEYFLLTTHRPGNVDNKKELNNLIQAAIKLVNKYQIRLIFPIHPRTRNNLKKFNLIVNHPLIELIEPVGYLEMLVLMQNAKLILTDSGGIQEEACILHVPSLTLRENTERPETLEVGASLLVGTDNEKILRGAEQMLNKNRDWKNPFGDGESGKKIIKELIL